MGNNGACRRVLPPLVSCWRSCVCRFTTCCGHSSSTLSTWRPCRSSVASSRMRCWRTTSTTTVLLFTIQRTYSGYSNHPVQLTLCRKYALVCYIYQNILPYKTAIYSELQSIGTVTNVVALTLYSSTLDLKLYTDYVCSWSVGGL